MATKLAVEPKIGGSNKKGPGLKLKTNCKTGFFGAAKNASKPAGKKA